MAVVFIEKKRVTEGQPCKGTRAGTECTEEEVINQATIRGVFGRMSALGVHTVGWKAPNEADRAHDSPWRIPQQVPQAAAERGRWLAAEPRSPEAIPPSAGSG